MSLSGSFSRRSSYLGYSDEENKFENTDHLAKNNSISVLKTIIGNKDSSESGDNEDNDSSSVLKTILVNKDSSESGDNEDNDSQQQERMSLKAKTWLKPSLRAAQAPHPLTVTHVNQTHQLQKLQDSLTAAKNESKSSEQWLLSYGIVPLKLTLKDLVDKGTIGRLHPDQQTGKVTHHIQFDAYDINEFEYRLNVAIEKYTQRIKWLLEGSKRLFGHLVGKNVAVCIDSSDDNLNYGRQTAFQESLLHLLDEQLRDKRHLYLVSYGTDIDPLWPQGKLLDQNWIEEAKSWIMGLSNKGGSNLMKAVKQVVKLSELDTIVLIVGSTPDQSYRVWYDYIYQLVIGSNLALHTVAYDFSDSMTNLSLKRLAESTSGRYHCYSSTCEEQIYTSTDISRLLAEIKEAHDILRRITEMKQGLIGNAIISIMNEISMVVSKMPQSYFLPHPPGHNLPLKVEVPQFHASTSQEWLKNRGLKAKRLNLYQVLSPNAYSYKEDFVPVIKKAVQSQVHEKAMIQFPWSDGSIKNLHVDMSQLFEYQKHLTGAVELYEKRIDWLAAGSRRIFGTVAEKNVVILVDTSLSNVNYLIHIQHSLRLLMEEQMGNKDFFNIIAFGSTSRQWMPTMVRPTNQHLQKAWKWILELQCEGSRNFLSAFRLAVENDEEIKHHLYVQGIYLFTSGIPDQIPQVVSSYIQEASSGLGVRLHTILFNVDDYDAKGAIPGHYANITKTAECLRNMAHISEGRFHWFRETGIIESDDIQLINAEIDKALNFSHKCAVLVESVKKKYKNKFLNQPEMRAIQSKSSLRHLHCLPQPELPTTFRALPAPQYLQEPQVLPTQVLQTHEAELEEPTSKYRAYGCSSQKVTGSPDKDQLKKIARRPSSATNIQMSREGKLTRRSRSQGPRSASARDPMLKVQPSFGGVAAQHFFLEDGKHRTGTVLKQSEQKSVRKQIPHIIMPEAEDPVTTKDWLRIYSLNKLKLNLNKLLSTPDCKHQEKNVKILQKNISAKVYPDVFPTVNIKGSLKYMQLLPHELDSYQAELETVLTRYLRRLQWLLSGSRRVFGTIIHQRVALLIDVSGSMQPHLEQLKKELASLVWEQLHKQQVQFNLITFSGDCSVWKDAVQPASEDNCHSAIGWISRLEAGGNTCTLQVLQLAFSDPDIDAVYLLTDGKPDSSTSLVLREVAKLNESRNIPVNTISFNCSDSTANTFLKLLASETGGRYHQVLLDFDAQIFVHKLLSEGFKDSQYPHLPAFEGDDLQRLGTEIALARRFLQQANIYKSIYEAKSKTGQKLEKPNIKTGPVPFLVGRTRPVAAVKS